MKHFHRLPLYLLLAAFAILGVRLTWVLVRSETGWKPQRDLWIDLAASQLGIETRSLDQQDPARQADCWLKQVSRVASTNDDPQVALGAACMLDAPQFGFVEWLPPATRFNPNNFEIRDHWEPFEHRCHSECWEQIERAILLDPKNVDLWRARALLMFREKWRETKLTPRRDDWQQVLEECIQHDPDNALYDYLAALELWESSAEYKWEKAGYVLSIKDAAKFDQGNTRFAAGLAKSHLVSSHAGYSATLAFLKKSSISPMDRLNGAGSRLVESGVTKNVDLLIFRWQTVQRDVERRKGDFRAVVATLRKVVEVSKKVSRDGKDLERLPLKLIMRRWALANLKELNRDHPGLLAKNEADRVATELYQVRLDLDVLSLAGRQLKANADNVIRKQGIDWLLDYSLMVLAQMVTIVSLAFALLSTGLLLIIRKGNDGAPVALRWYSHLIAWGIGTALSFVLLGMCPAQIISTSIQAWGLYVLMWVGVILVIWGLLYVIHRRFELPWSGVLTLSALATFAVVVIVDFSQVVERTTNGLANLPVLISVVLLLACAWICWLATHWVLAFLQTDTLSRIHKVMVCGFLLVLASAAIPVGKMLFEAASDPVKTMPLISPSLWSEASGPRISADELQQLAKLDNRWIWAVLHWPVHLGPLAAVCFSAVIVVIWGAYRQGPRNNDTSSKTIAAKLRELICLGCRLVALTSLRTSLVCIIIYLAVTPSYVERLDRQYRELHARIAIPTQLSAEIEAAMVRIRADKSQMAKLTEDVAKQNRELERVLDLEK